jgi:hypothetical protein
VGAGVFAERRERIVSDRLEVRAADLVAHAGHVETVGDHVRTAKQAGSAVRPNGDAYGKLCVAVPVMLGALQDVLVDGIGAAADALHDTAGRLRNAAQSYEVTDQRRAQVTDRIKDDL